MARLANAAFVVVAARRLGAAAYGLYATTLAVLFLGRLLVRVGSPGLILVRDVAEDRSRAGTYLGTGVALGLLTSLLLWVALPWVVPRIGYEAALGPLLVVGGAALPAHALGRPAEDVLRAVERLGLVAGILTVVALVSAGAGLVLVATGADVVALLALHASMAWVEAAWLLAVVRSPALGTRLRPPAWSAALAAARRLGREGGILGLLGVLDYAASRLDLLVLARLQGAVATGLYAPAVRVVEYLALPRVGASGALVPFLAGRRAAPASLGKAYREARRWYVLYGIAAAVALTAGAGRIVHLLLGPPFLPAIPALQLLAWTLAADLAAGPYAEVILVRERSLGRFVPGLAALAGLNLILSLVLVPSFAQRGAAGAALATALAALGLRTRWVRQALGTEAGAFGSAAWRALAAGTVMGGVFVLGAPFGFWATLLPAGVAYGAALILLGALRPEETAWLRRVLPGQWGPPR